jgi:hypothetical protein
MDASRMAATLAHLTRDEVPEFLRAVALFERCDILAPAEAEAWRIAVRARAAELSEPVAEA